MTIAFACQTHCAQGMDPAVFSQIVANAPGVTYVRDELFFGHVYDGVTFALTSTFSTYLDSLAASGLGLVLELLWGNVHATGHAFNIPRTSGERETFCDYASFIIDEVKGRSIPIFGCHLWNEISGSWPGQPGITYSGLTTEQRDTLAVDYTALATAVRARLAVDHADVLFAAGADIALQLDWLNRVITTNSLLDQVDALDLHPYGGVSNLPTVRALMAAEGFSSMPIWVTEYGATSDVAELVRVGADFASKGATLISYYLSKPFGSFQVNASLLDATGNPTAHGSQFNYFATLLGPSTYEGAVSGPGGIRAEKFARAGDDDVTVVWSDVGVPITVSGETKIEALNGTPIAAATQYSITATPIYIFGDAITLGAGVGDTLLADYGELYTVAEQGNPFFYLADRSAGEVQMTANVSLNRWEVSGVSFYNIAAASMHPPAIATDKSLIRFVVPADVTRLKVKVTVNRSTGGDGSDIWIFHNATTRWRRKNFAGGVEQEILQVFDVQAGDEIDFVVGPGDAGNNANDAVTFTGLSYYETADAVTPVDLGPVIVVLVVKDGADNLIGSLVAETAVDAATGRRKVSFVPGMIFTPPT